LIDETLSLCIKDKQVTGVVTKDNGVISCSYVVITSGTYMNAKAHIGLHSRMTGPVYDTKKQLNI
jgi:tRNA U34 5-carboxymethylaminomethyl modifying enzyme MnmG/GidA